MTRAVLIVTAGCSVRGPASSAQSGPGPAQIWHRYAQCVRDHGAPGLPDPVVEDQGRASFRDDAARAMCIRDHGIQDWPDPDAQGRFHLPSSLQGKNSPRWPQIQAAWNGPCKWYDPSGSIRTA